MSATADRLYNLLPAVYRVRDIALGEPLRALLAIIESELNAIDEDISGLYENWFIETCQEWVAPYIGDLLGVRGLKPISGGPFTARPYVAHTLKYRRSKGTAAMVEGFARDVTNWPSRVVEFFELLDATQHLNHLRPGNVITPDFRDTNALELLGGPFEQANHTLEVRSAGSAGGKYNVPDLGIFLWRLESFPITRGTPRPVTDGTDGRYWFNPLGLDAPLFNQPQALPGGARASGEAQVPGMLRRRALFDDLEALRQAIVDNRTPAPVYFGANPPFAVSVAGSPVPPEKIIICDLSDLPSPAGSWPQPPASLQFTPTSGGPPITMPITVSVDPVLGRLFFTAGSVPADPAGVLVSYSYAFSGNVGGGPYDRSTSLPEIPPNQRSFQVAVTKQLPADNRTVFATLTDAMSEPTAGWNTQPPGTFGVVAILDSETYADSPSISIPDNSHLLIVAADWPGLRKGAPAKTTIEPVGTRPHISGTLHVTGTAAPESLTPGGVALNGLLIDGSLTVEPGNLGSLQLADCTVAPGTGGIQVSAQVKSAASTRRGLTRTAARPAARISVPINITGPSPLLPIIFPPPPHRRPFRGSPPPLRSRRRLSGRPFQSNLSPSATQDSPGRPGDCLDG
jgi:hypothetical protein